MATYRFEFERCVLQRAVVEVEDDEDESLDQLREIAKRRAADSETRWESIFPLTGTLEFVSLSTPTRKGE